MRDSGPRKGVGKILVHTHRLEPLTLSHLMVIIFKMVVVLGHKVPIISLVEPSKSYHILLASFVISCIVGFIVRRGINVSIIVRLIICSGIVLLGLLLGLIGFQLPLHQFPYQRVLFLVLAWAITVFMLSLPTRCLRHVLMSSLVFYNSFLVMCIFCLIRCLLFLI